MNATYRLIQLIPVASNPEPITVGVILWSTRFSAIRLLGDDLVQFDTRIGRLYRDLAGRAQEYPQNILTEWFAWFRAIVHDGKPLGESEVAALDRIVADSPFVVPLAGQVEAVVGARAADAERQLCDQLFSELVLDKPAVRRLLLRERVVRACRMADLTEENGLVLDAEVELLPHGRQSRTLLYFPILIERKKRVAFQLLQLDAVPERVSEEVSRTISVFDVAVRSGLVNREDCIAAIHPATAIAPRYLRCLRSVATVLDVTKPNLVQRVRALAGG